MINQAAGDVGYLFGCSCGTAPRDELIVYNGEKKNANQDELYKMSLRQ